MRERNSKRYWGFKTLIPYLVLSSGLVLTAFPYFWMVLASIKPEEEIYTRFWPTRLTMEHYVFILGGEMTGTEYLFLKALWNSLVVATGATASVVFFSALTGYVLAKHQVAGKDWLNRIILLQMLVPPILFLIPRFLIVLKLKLVNSYLGMMLPFLMSAWATFLFAQFFRTIPDDLIQAARLDGCSEFRIVFRIMMPLARSVIAIVSIFTFIAMWDEFLWYLIVTKDYRLMPLSVLLALFTKGEFDAYPGVQMAGATLLSLPVFVLFFLFRRYFTEGIALTGLKT